VALFGAGKFCLNPLHIITAHFARIEIEALGMDFSACPIDKQPAGLAMSFARSQLHNNFFLNCGVKL
jgi:hypothetical protein